MKESELARAHADFERQSEKLGPATDRVDIVVEALLTGLLLIGQGTEHDRFS